MSHAILQRCNAQSSDHSTRAMPLTIWLVIAFAFLVAITTTSDFSSSVLTLADAAQHDGYYLDSLNDVAPAAGPETLQCPSDNVITTRYKCNVNSEWVDCTRKHCCPDYIFIANKCIPKDQDPCLMNLCEQRCTVYLQRVICTCFDGYKFNPDHQRKAITPVCVDVNECEDKNGDCQHECINEIGSYRCECSAGFVLRADNRTCDTDTEAAIPGDVQAATRDHCFANCDTVQRLHEKVKVLQEKILALSTAVHMSSFASGPPGPPGPPGPVGPRGFPGIDETTVGRTTAGRDVTLPDYTYSMLDAFVPLPGDGHHQASFCRCKRGAIGPSGSTGAEGRKGEPGERGQRGPKGDKGSLDFVLLLLADLRHDVVHLQNKVYKADETPPHFDLNQALKKHRVKEKQQQRRKNQLLQGYAAPAIEMTASAAPSEGIRVENSPENVSGEQTLLDRDSKSGELSFTTAGIERTTEEQSLKSRTTSSPKPIHEEDDAIFIADYLDYEGSSYEDSYENYS